MTYGDYMNVYIEKIISTVRKGKYFLFPSSFAFYMLFALVPALTSLELLLNVLNLNNDILVKYVYTFLPAESSSELISFLSRSPSLSDGINLIITFFISMYLISRGIFVFMNVSRTLYNHKDNMSVIKKLSYSFFLALFFIVSLFLIILVDVVLTMLIDGYNELFSILEYLLIFLVLCLCLSFIYFFGSNRRIKIKESYLGSLVASLGITLSIFIFNLYTQYVVNYNNTYGPLSWIIILLVLFRLISTFIYVGLIINVVNYKEKRLVNTSR